MDQKNNNKYKKEMFLTQKCLKNISKLNAMYKFTFRYLKLHSFILVAIFLFSLQSLFWVKEETPGHSFPVRKQT